MKTSKKVTIMVLKVLFIISLGFNLNGQNTSIDYSTNSIYLKGNKFVKNGESFPKGFLSKNLKKELEVSKAAIGEFKKYEKKRNLSILFSTLTISSILLYDNVDKDNLRTGILIGGLSSLIVTIPLTRQSYNHLNKAIWLRNGMF